ncbi:hypothetical protein DH09_05755 [Bacillaceae bacterium JMAK1]|nr:hypothetical protein DH09_05755 [Bacillaceae bacterium JMAK1]
MTRLQNKIAVVTGATSGIGLGIAKQFSKEGATVIATDLQPGNIDEEVPEATFMRLDVSSEEDWKQVVKSVIEEHQTIDILVNNAGIHFPDKLLETSLDDYNRMMDTNATSVFLGMKEVVPHMQRNENGSIINIVSLAALTGSGAARGNGTAYSAAKGAVRALTNHAANHFAKDRIRVNAIFPGPIKTPIMGERQHTIEENNRDVVPLPPHHGEPIDIAHGAVYFASDESRFVTGDELVIDGGSVR